MFHSLYVLVSYSLLIYIYVFEELFSAYKIWDRFELYIQMSFNLHYYFAFLVHLCALYALEPQWLYVQLIMHISHIKLDHFPWDFYA